MNDEVTVYYGAIPLIVKKWGNGFFGFEGFSREDEAQFNSG